MSQIWTGYNDLTNVTGHQLQKRNNRESCVSPLTTAKLTRSCADVNPGAINYTQFTTDMALELNERCQTLALEHHKCPETRTSEARDGGCHAKTSGKAARDLSRGSLMACGR